MTVTPSDALHVRVYLEDTDAGGIVYHAAYLRFMERARTESLRRAGVQQSDTFGRDLSFVLHTLNVRFSVPAQLDAELYVTCDLSELRGASLTFTQEIRDRNSAVLHCSAEVVVACISLSNKRPRRVPPEVAERLQRYQR